VRLRGGGIAAVCAEVLATLLIDWPMPGNRTRPLSETAPLADDMGKRVRLRPSRPSRRLTAQ